MKKIHILESKLNEIGHGNNNAGTDTPYYEDENGNVYEAYWNYTYGFPFGYWPTDYYGNNMMFCVGKPYTTHGDACGQAAERYVMDILGEELDDASYQLADAFGEFESDFNEYGYHYDEGEDCFVSEDESESKDVYDFTEDIVDKVSSPVDIYEYVKSCLEEFLFNDTKFPDSQEILNYLWDGFGSEYDFSNKDGITDALKTIDVDFYDFFEKGYGEGRVWPGEQMIGFYPSEQPDPETLRQILYDLQENADLTVDELLGYMMIFEDWRNDGEVTACTVNDYIDGNYGPESYEDEDDDEPMQYNNGQKTVFVPHLANQDQKREFFKDFRNTRDQAVYVPREKGAGSLAAYHAMRYPYGENKDKIGKIITEVINKYVKRRN